MTSFTAVNVEIGLVLPTGGNLYSKMTCFFRKLSLLMKPGFFIENSGKTNIENRKWSVHTLERTISIEK